MIPKPLSTLSVVIPSNTFRQESRNIQHEKFSNAPSLLIRVGESVGDSNSLDPVVVVHSWLLDVLLAALVSEPSSSVSALTYFVNDGVGPKRRCRLFFFVR